ncbi:MAG TPA: rhodanese-like domain-containing protein [Polyangiaceae bacterium]|jgi:rhodanese-related sulfurtransferase
MADPTRISPQEASAKLAEGWTYVDVRTTQEFEAGHPPGAVNVPLMHAGGGGMVPNPDFLAVMTAAFPKDARLVVGCKSGGRSLRAAQALLGAGFTSVLDQRAGWDGARNPFGQVTEAGWSRAGLPIEEGQPEGRSWASVSGAAAAQPR